MSQQLINHSPDLKRLRDEGYEIEVRGGYLLIHHVPYVNQSKKIQFGSLVSTLTLSNNRTKKPDDHVINFIGENPCDRNGNVITAIQHENTTKILNNSITVNRSFSNKPANGYSDYYEKVATYANIISAPAKYLNPAVTEKTFKAIPDTDDETVFQYIDTNSSRANIERINSKLQGQKISIIGLGGTGAYILDLVAKTPVQEIHLYDGDSFDQHNAFRSPGAASINILNENPSKVAYYKSLYSNIHKFIRDHENHITQENLYELNKMTYVFVCVDKNSVRKMIAKHLVSIGIPFFDVGLGINIVDDKLMGAVRVTSATSEKNDHLSTRIPSEDTDHNDYATNIQIAELNSLNASFAVLKWKKMSGFYADLEEEYHSSYSTETSVIFNEDSKA